MNSFRNLEMKGTVKVKLNYNFQKDMLIFCIEDSFKSVNKTDFNQISKLLRKNNFQPCPTLLKQIKKNPFFLGLFVSNYHIRQNNGKLIY